MFVIPSWYPSKTRPIAGLFTSDQIEATAEFCERYRMIVSTWGHDAATIPTSRFWDAPKVIIWALRQKRDQVRPRGNVWEIFNPAITWSPRLPISFLPILAAANQRNFEIAQATFGPIELVHAHVSYPGGYIARQISEKFGVPYIITEHMGPFPPATLRTSDGKPVFEILSAFSNASAAIAVSPALARAMVEFGIKEPIVIPNVVDERRFGISKPSGSKFIFFTLARIDYQKGIGDLLHAIALWDPSPDEVEFQVGGDGPALSTYQRLAHALKVSDRVKWLGAIKPDDRPRLFGNSHAFVLPSLQESFGVVYVEAIASGKPVIATRCGGPESIINEVNGRLVEINDPNALAVELESMCKQWRDFDPVAIRNDFEKRFSRAPIANAIGELYDSILPH